MASSQHSNLDALKAYRGLAWLALGNIVCAAILVTASDLFRKYNSASGFVVDPFVGIVLTDRFATISGQVLAWAIICALIPQRRFIGLLWSAVFAVALGTINWLGFVVEDPASAVATASVVMASCQSLAIFAIAQGLRFLLGWRLTLHDEPSASRRARFGIADLIEWTLSIGIYFGLGHLGGWFHNLSLLARFVTWQVLVSLPVALAIMSRRGPHWLWILVALCTAFATSAIFKIANGYFDFRGASWRGFLQHTFVLATSYVVATALNFIVARQLGFRSAILNRQSPSSDV